MDWVRDRLNTIIYTGDNQHSPRICDWRCLLAIHVFTLLKVRLMFFSKNVFANVNAISSSSGVFISASWVCRLMLLACLEMVQLLELGLHFVSVLPHSLPNPSLPVLGCSCLPRHSQKPALSCMKRSAPVRLAFLSRECFNCDCKQSCAPIYGKLLLLRKVLPKRACLV